LINISHLLGDLSSCQLLYSLSLCDIPSISTIESISFIKTLQNLCHIYFQQPKNSSTKSYICNIPDYKAQIANLYPQLKTIDNSHVAFLALPQTKDVFKATVSADSDLFPRITPWVGDDKSGAVFRFGHNLYDSWGGLDETIMGVKKTLEQINEYAKENSLS
jgi:hypothetical protein